MDPTGRRENKPRQRGRTMIIDKGLGLRAFEDLLETAGEYIDMIKLGFGTAALYPREVLQKKSI
nr:phosphosulfolactate synthase [Paenibacillus larvae]